MLNWVSRFFIRGFCISKVLILLLHIFVITACDNRNRVAMPFSPTSNLTFEEVSSKAHRSGLTGDGFLIRRWLVYGDENALSRASDPLAVNRRLVWLAQDDIRFIEVFVFLGRFSEMRGILTEVQMALRNPSTRIGFEEIITSERGIEACSVWIFDPIERTLIYLNAKG